MFDNDIDRNGEMGTVQPPEDASSDWLKETRSRAQASEVPKPTQVRESPWRWCFQFGLRAAALLAVCWCCWVWGRHALRTTTEVQGKLCDRKGRPVAGVWVFLTADPKVETITDRNGVFRLPQVPLGRQSLVAAQDGAGQEFRFHAGNYVANDMGGLIYLVPPLSVRRSPGGGAYWEEP